MGRRTAVPGVIGCRISSHSFPKVARSAQTAYSGGGSRPWHVVGKRSRTASGSCESLVTVGLIASSLNSLLASVLRPWARTDPPPPGCDADGLRAAASLTGNDKRDRVEARCCSTRLRRSPGHRNYDRGWRGDKRGKPNSCWRTVAMPAVLTTLGLQAPVTTESLLLT